MEKKIGILTHWSIPNFGSFLQAYALQRVISELFPQYDVRQIAYMNKVHAKMYYGYEMHEIYRLWLINPNYYKDILHRIRKRKQIKQIRKFKDYYEEYIPHTGELEAKQLERQHFDSVILGSDIIWDYSISFYNHDKYVFGNSLDSDHIISYAASFGTVKPGSAVPEYVVDGLRSLSAISVRDSNSMEIADSIANKKSTLVLDPTLLWDFRNDSKIEKPAVDYKYIVVYGSFFSDDHISFVKKFSKDHGLKIVYLDSVGDSCDWCDYFIPAETISPFQWSGYIKYAEYLMTCTFHGLMFGMVFNKRILFNATQFMRDKSTEFIQYLGLDDILLGESSFDKMINYEWDYCRINALIELRREQSIAFLMENL